MGPSRLFIPRAHGSSTALNTLSANFGYAPVDYRSPGVGRKTEKGKASASSRKLQTHRVSPSGDPGWWEREPNMAGPVFQYTSLYVKISEGKKLPSREV